MTFSTISIKEYLTKKNIPFREAGNEIITQCLFNDCDSDSLPNEGHLYFNIETGQYDCKKCGEQGNIVTLSKHFGDSIQEIALNPIKTPKKHLKSAKFEPSMAEECHQALPNHIRQYLNDRGLSDLTINKYQLGWGKFYNTNWITIPIKDDSGNFSFFKLRKDPNNTENSDKYKFWPTGSEADIYCKENLKNSQEIVICEGEFDCLILNQNNIPAITSTAGVNTFKPQWVKLLSELTHLYICFDKDEAGKNGAKKIIELINGELPKLTISQIDLPERMTEGKDITDYFVKYNGNKTELLTQLPHTVIEKFDLSQLQPLTTNELMEILDLTIKKDNVNKIVTFLCFLSAYTENGQFNIIFNAPSSTGKSFIPLEIAKLFPDVDLMKLGNCSPTAFFHEQGEYDKEKNIIIIDLSRKIIIFLDQPSTFLLEKLRSLLSHDEKEMQSKITDKNQNGGNRTKTVIIKGFPAVACCSAGLKIDEQEGTRFLLLSPEIGQEKLQQSIHEKIKKSANTDEYNNSLKHEPKRKMLMERIKMIKAERINEVIIPHPEKIEEAFFKSKKCLKPRHNRDIGRLMEIIKSLALMNLWFRKRQGDNILANDEDINQGLEIWNKISETLDLNLPPYIYDLYKNVIVPAYNEKNINSIKEGVGISKKELLTKHYNIYERTLDDSYLRNQILPMLETAGLIVTETNPSDKRQLLISPTKLLINPQKPKQ